MERTIMAAITCITVTCPGREMFLEQCKKYVARFTLQPEAHIVVSSTDFRKNIKDALGQVKTELVAFIEDDDWYAPGYLKDMVTRLTYSRRALIGYDPTMYYHIVHKGYTILPHKGRASLFATVGISSILVLAYDKLYNGADGRNFSVDIGLWNLLSDVAVTTVGHLAIGIEHGLTKTEGRGHYYPKNYWAKDENSSYLKQLIGEDDADAYSRIIDSFIAGGPGLLPEVP